MPVRTFYEVYTKQAIREPIEGLVVLDRDRNIEKAKKAAREWGGCVVQVTAMVTQERPLQREVISYKLVWVHKPVRPAEGRDKVTRKQLRGKIKKLK